MSVGFEFLPAAHKHHAVEHSLATVGQAAGALVGVVIGGILTLATGVGALVIIPLASAGADIGKHLAKNYFPKETSGAIKDGAATVVYGPTQKPATRITDPIDCKDPLAAYLPGVVGDVAATHLNKFIEMGAFGVTIENLEASRLNDLTKCGSNIASAIDTIWIGGATIYVDPPSEISEDNPYVDLILGVAGLIDAVKRGPLSIVKYGVKLLVDALFGKDSWASAVVSTLFWIFGGIKGDSTAKTVDKIARKLAGGVKAGKKGHGAWTGPKPNPPLSPAMRQRRKVLLTKRPVPTLGDQAEDWMRFINNRGN